MKNKISEFYRKFDKNYVPVAGANRKLEIKDWNYISGLKPDDLVGVRSVITEDQEKSIRFSFGFFEDMTIRSDPKYLSIEVLLYKRIDEQYVPLKIIRLKNPLVSEKKFVSNYKVADSQRDSHKMGKS